MMMEVCKPIDGISRERYNQIRDQVIRNMFRILSDRWPHITNTAVATDEMLDAWLESRMDEDGVDFNPMSLEAWEGMRAKMAEDMARVVQPVIDRYREAVAAGADFSVRKGEETYGANAASLINPGVPRSKVFDDDE